MRRTTPLGVSGGHGHYGTSHHQLRTGTHEQLELIRVRGEMLVFQTMNWPEEIRSLEGIAPSADVTVRPQEVQMATNLMDALSRDFDLAELCDRYRDAMTELVTSKLEGQPLPEAAAVTPAPRGRRRPHGGPAGQYRRASARPLGGGKGPKK
jgi:non-homologous end joining protein Ku